MATHVVLGNYLTGNSHLGGDILEWIVYDRCLSSEECLEVETYLAGRAGLGPLLTPGSLGLAEAHPMTIPVDVGPAPTWTLNLADRSVTVTNRSDPGLLIVPETAGYPEVRARIRGSGTSGFIGFVVAYQDAGNFVLFDWNIAPTNHPVYGLAPRGMRLRQFHLPAGVSPSGADLWSGTDPMRVTTFGTNAVPWVAGQNYDLVIRSLADRMEVEVRRGSVPHFVTLSVWLWRACRASELWMAGHSVGAAPTERSHDSPGRGSPTLLDLTGEAEAVVVALSSTASRMLAKSAFPLPAATGFRALAASGPNNSGGTSRRDDDGCAGSSCPCFLRPELAVRVRVNRAWVSAT